MNDNNTPVETPGAAFVDAVVEVECAQCGAPISAGERAVQALGLPGMFCLECGIAALHLRPGTDESDDAEDSNSVDVFEALRQEYEVRNVLGWSTPPAVLVIDPEEGPTWRLGIAEDDDTTCLGRGELNGDRLEVTFYQPFPQATTA